MEIGLGNFGRFLKPGISDWAGMAYNEHPAEWKEIFKEYASEQYFEEDVAVGGLGAAGVKYEGKDVQFDSMQQGWTQRTKNVTYGTGFILTREFIEDNQYMKLVEEQSRELGRACRQAEEIVGADILNNAFSGTTYADGATLCATAQPTITGGAFANRPASGADLSELALEDALVALGGFIDNAGKKIAIKGRKLVVPHQLQYDAARILNSPMKNDTAENAINAIRNQSVLPEGFVINHYLSDADAFFVLTDCADGLKRYNRRPLMIDQEDEMSNQVVKYIATLRFSYGVKDKRAIYGSPGAA